MKKEQSKRYDLPGSRILIRSLRYIKNRIERVTPAQIEPALEKQINKKVLAMVRDLFMVRLLEDKRVIGDWYLRGGKKSYELDGKQAGRRLREFNDWAGWEVFEAGAWEDTGPGQELARLDHELHLSRFWPAAMPIEVLGALWEERLPTPKRTGVFYTPRRIVELVVSAALDDLIKDTKPKKLTVLDPACGSGYFLLETYRRLAGRELSRYRSQRDLFAPIRRGETGRDVLEPEKRMDMIRDHLFGVDLDAGALEIARRALFVEAVADVAAFNNPAPAHKPLFDNLREGDSILEQRFPQQVKLFDSDGPPPLKPFDWNDKENGFGKIIGQGGFTCIVGNPPWVSLKGRHRQAPYSKEVVEHLSKQYNADTYRPNMVEFFIRKAIQILAEGGRHSFVVPDRIAENEQYDPLRKFMVSNGEIHRLHYREPFPGVAADTLIYVYQKRARPRRSQKILVTDSSGRKREVPQGHWARGKNHVTIEIEPDYVEEILKKIETAGRRNLSDFLDTGVGFISKPGLISKKQTGEAQKPVIKGEHIVPYQRRGCAWFEFAISNLAGGTRNLEKLTRTDRILLRKTGARLVAARDESQDLPEQSLYFAFPCDRRLARPYDLAYFLGILNSRIMSFYFRHRKITNRATTPQIKKVHLDLLPIRPIHFNNPKTKQLHDELAGAVKQREKATEPKQKKELDQRVEKCVAIIYGLDDRELMIITSEMDKGWE